MTTLETLAQRFGVEVADLAWFRPRYNIAPTQAVPAITNQVGRLEVFRWGLMPHWAKDAKIGYQMINAR